MSCYVDMLIDYGWKLGPSCHLLADTEEELHEMAAKIGMKRMWFQKGGRAEMPHYDLVASRRKKAVALGAVEINRKQLCEMLEAYWHKTKAVKSEASKTEAIADEGSAGKKLLKPVMKPNCGIQAKLL